MPLFDWRTLGSSRLLRQSAVIHAVGPEARAQVAREILHAGLQPDVEAEALLERTRWLEEHRAERSFPCGVVPGPGTVATDEPRSGGPVADDRAADTGEPGRPLLPSDPGWASPEPTVVVAAPPPRQDQAAPGAEPSPEGQGSPSTGSEPPASMGLASMSVLAAVLPDDLVFLREYGSGADVEEVGRLPRSAIEDVDVVDETDAHVPDPIGETIEPSQPVFAVLRWSNAGTPDEDRFLFRSRWQAWQAAHRLLAAKR